MHRLLFLVALFLLLNSISSLLQILPTKSFQKFRARAIPSKFPSFNHGQWVNFGCSFQSLSPLLSFSTSCWAASRKKQKFSDRQFAFPGPFLMCRYPFHAIISSPNYVFYSLSFVPFCKFHCSPHLQETLRHDKGLLMIRWGLFIPGLHCADTTTFASFVVRVTARGQPCFSSNLLIASVALGGCCHREYDTWAIIPIFNTTSRLDPWFKRIQPWGPVEFAPRILHRLLSLSIKKKNTLSSLFVCFDFVDRWWISCVPPPTTSHFVKCHFFLDANVFDYCLLAFVLKHVATVL